VRLERFPDAAHRNEVTTKSLARWLPEDTPIKRVQKERVPSLAISFSDWNVHDPSRTRANGPTLSCGANPQQEAQGRRQVTVALSRTSMRWPRFKLSKH